MRVALVQQNIIIGDFSGIEKVLRESYQSAQESGVDAVVFPELATTGYPLVTFWRAHHLLKRISSWLSGWSSGPKPVPRLSWVFVEPNPSPVGNRLFNSAAVLQKGEWTDTIRKSFFPRTMYLMRIAILSPHPIGRWFTCAVALSGSRSARTSGPLQSTGIPFATPLTPAPNWSNRVQKCSSISQRVRFRMARAISGAESYRKKPTRWAFP